MMLGIVNSEDKVSSQKQGMLCKMLIYKSVTICVFCQSNCMHYIIRNTWRINLTVFILKHHVISKGAGARDTQEQKPEGASSNPPRPGDPVAKQSCTPITNPQDPTLTPALLGAVSTLPMVKNTSCEPNRCLLI